MQDTSLLINPGEATGTWKRVQFTSDVWGKPLVIFYFPACSCSYCLDSSLNSTKARGKVLVCHHAESSTESKLAKSKVVKEAGGVGMVLIDDADKDVAIPFIIPSAIVGRRIGEKILSYINGTRFVFLFSIQRLTI